MRIVNYEGKEVELPTPGFGVIQAILQAGTFQGVSVVGTALHAHFTRAVVPVTGTIQDISIVNSTVLGNANVAIFDTGDAVAGKYTLLAESGSKVQVGKEEFQSMGTLGGLALKAGQHVMLAAMSSGGGNFLGTPEGPIANALPSEYLKVAGGASPKLAGEHTYAELKFATIAEAELTVANRGAYVIARIA